MLEAVVPEDAARQSPGKESIAPAVGEIGHFLAESPVQPGLHLEADLQAEAVEIRRPSCQTFTQPSCELAQTGFEAGQMSKLRAMIPRVTT